MSNQSDNNNPLDLSGLDFGPAWARNDAPQKKTYHESDGKSHKPQGRGDKRRDRRDGDNRGYSDRPPRKKFAKRRDVDYERPRRQIVPLPEGVKASIMPIEEGVDNMVKEISATGRTYSIFDLSRLILKSRDRYNICFTVGPDSDIELYQAGEGATAGLYLSTEEALNHFASSEKFSELYKQVEVEAEAPSGNFPSIACCGFKDEPIAPPNYHGYQTIVAERHAADFSNMSLEKYKSRIKIVRDEEKVAAWLESMKKQVKYQLASDESVEFDTKADAVNHFKMNGFVAAYPAQKKAFVRSDIAFKQLSSGLATGLADVISEQNRYPGELSSFLCRQLSGRHLAVYKWQGKLHAGPSRPHAIPDENTLADRPKALLLWLKENSGKGIDELWKGVWGEGEIKEEDKTAWFHDLHWMLNQGYLVLLENGSIHLSSDSKKKTAPSKKSTKKNSKKPQPKAEKQDVKQEKKEVEKKEAEPESKSDLPKDKE